MNMPIKVIVADDHAVFRAGIIALLEKDPEMQVVAEAGSGPETLDAVRKYDFDVLTLDLSMPDSDGPAQAAKVLALRPKAGIVVLTMHEDPFYLQEMLKAGALGYVVKKSTGNCLFDAIRAVHRHNTYIDPTLAGSLLSPAKSGARNELAGKATVELTSREREVCALLARGHTNAEVADLLGISSRTVETHRNNLMGKLGLKSRAELVRYAVSQQILTFVK
jgi:DNA-binding NarL/FixJ family response regulator